MARRRELLARTALCGVIGGLLVAAPAVALPQLDAGSAPRSSGGAPTISSGGNQTNVGLQGARTVIDWTSFNVGGGESVNFAFQQRNGIVLNRVTGGAVANIDGTVSGTVGGAPGGNVWIASPGGIIFGASSRFEAGGLMATTAFPNLDQFLDPTNLRFDFATPPSTVFGIETRPGAQILGHGGAVALISPIIKTGTGSLTSSDQGGSVLFGGAESFQVRLAQRTSGDLDLVDFLVPAAGFGSGVDLPFNLQGDISASSVYVAAVSRPGVASAVINLGGMVQAQAASGGEGGDIVLSGGGGILNKGLAPTLADAGGTDIYLTRAAASRDIIAQTTGSIYGALFTPPPETGPVTGGNSGNGGNGNGNGGNGNGGNGNGNGNGNGFRSSFDTGLGPSAITAPPLIFDNGGDTSVSNLLAGRSVKLVATQQVHVGAIQAGQDILLQGATVEANTLVSAAGSTTLTAQSGLAHAGSVTAGGAVTVDGVGQARIDQLQLTGSTTTHPVILRVTGAGASVVLGDGTTSLGAPALITLSATGDAILNLPDTVSIDTVTAGGDATIRAASITGGSVSAGGAANIVTTGDLKLNAAGGVDVYAFSTGGAVTVGQATSRDDIYIRAGNGAASLGSATITPTGPDAVAAIVPGSTDADGNGRVVSVQGLGANGDALIGLGTGSLSGATKVTVDAARDGRVEVVGPANITTLNAGRDAVVSSATVSFQSLTAGRDVTLNANAGDFTATSTLTAARNITVSASGNLRAVDVSAPGGSASLTGATVTAGAISAQDDVTLRATNGAMKVASYRSGRDLTVQGASIDLGSAIAPVGRDLSVTTPGDLTFNYALTAGRNAVIDSGGKLSLTSLQAGGDARIVATDLDLLGALTGVNVQVESRSGAMRVGGAAGNAGAGLGLDSTEFGRIRASGRLDLYAGSTTGTARGDLTLLDLDVNTANVPQLNLYAGPTANVLVQGTAAPTATGGQLRIGHVTDTAWRPGSILITGSLGTATVSGVTYTNVRAFSDVRLVATQDILMGSSRFIGLVQAAAPSDINIGRALPTGVTPQAGEQNKLFIAAGRLGVSSEGKVVSQNTSPDRSVSTGVFLLNSGQPALTIDPPMVVDLFGAFIDSSGKVVTGLPAATTLASSSGVAVVPAPGTTIGAPAGSIYRFNGCVIDAASCASGGGGGAGSNEDQQINAAQSFQLGAAGESLQAAVTLALQPVNADRTEEETDPVAAGTGNEEIWRRRGAP